MATRVPALIQLSDPRVAAQLVLTMAAPSRINHVSFRVMMLYQLGNTYREIGLCKTQTAV